MEGINQIVTATGLKFGDWDDWAGWKKKINLQKLGTFNPVHGNS